MNKPIIAAIILAVAILGGVLISTGAGSKTIATAPVNNVTVTDGKQIVEIGVKGGYSPKVSTAKADMPTTLRMKTDGTFDCSSGVTIPSLGYRQILPSTGSTDIEVPAQKAGTTLDGVCVMGMYHFAVSFN